MEIAFNKYQGTGNDFIIIDDRDGKFPMENNALIEKLCHRKFGIGADGLILLQNKKGFDFSMKYFNADGKEGSMCGNGGRCIVAFAKKINIIKIKAHFWAIDGEHHARIENNMVHLNMGDVQSLNKYGNDWVLNTGSPHYVKFVKDLSVVDIYKEGKKIRNNSDFQKKGINVNFVEITKNGLLIATYERGVENETLSCGTGVTAAAIVCGRNNIGLNKIDIKAKGGDLGVSFNNLDNSIFKEIILSGLSIFVFDGVINI